ncbi:MAG: hypothetical protein WAT79_11080 [Saprospiraceae bacterium]
MINIQFKLKDQKAEYKTSIQCVFYYNSKRFVYSLGDDKTIIPELWDERTMRALNTKNMASKALKELLKQYSSDNYNVENELNNINQRIDNVINEITKFISNKEIQNQPLILNELKNHLHTTFNNDKNLPKQIIVKAIALNEYIEKFITDISKGQRTYTTRNGERNQYAAS